MAKPVRCTEHGIFHAARVSCPRCDTEAELAFWKTHSTEWQHMAIRYRVLFWLALACFGVALFVSKLVH